MLNRLLGDYEKNRRKKRWDLSGWNTERKRIEELKLIKRGALMFEYQPILRGELVELRPLRADDYDALYAVAADPLIWEQHPASNRYEERIFQRFFEDALMSGGALIAVDANTKSVIGSSRFHGYDEEKSEVEIGWTFLARSHWGGRYNGEMKKLMLQHAFRFVTSVVFLIGPQNFRSQRAVEKIGAVRAGSRTDEEGCLRYVYQITALTFTALRPGAE